MAIHRYRKAFCPKCDREVQFQIELDYVDYNGYIPCLRCPSCNTVVPSYSFQEYTTTGRIIIGL